MNNHFLKHINNFKNSTFFKKGKVITSIQEYPEIADYYKDEHVIIAKPEKNLAAILDYLAETYHHQKIIAEDTETRMFLKAIPVCESISEGCADTINKNYPGIIIKEIGIVSHDENSLEQAVIYAGAIAFAAFVKFFFDYWVDYKQENTQIKQKVIFNNCILFYKDLLSEISEDLQFIKGPFEEEQSVKQAIRQAGKHMVDNNMVDSFFGNISYHFNDSLYITTSGSYLNDLEHSIVKAQIEGNNKYASSELPAHQAVLKDKMHWGLIHGHPRFSVIMSLICEKDNCEHKGKCHTHCQEKRFVGDIPIVTGESGGGENSIAGTLPLVMKTHDTVIVFGHGVFAKSKSDFSAAFINLIKAEKESFKKYIDIFL